MKRTTLLPGIFLLLALPTMASASFQSFGKQLYHSEEGLVCTDCHDQFGANHAASQDGTTPAAVLKKADISDLCLSCHTKGRNTAYTADLPGVQLGDWTAPIVMTDNGITPPGIAMPAGDFFWSNSDPRKGHNPAYTKDSSVPTSKAIKGDPVLGNTPPGGSLAGPQWSCISCHGAHSRFDGSNSSWRQLKRKVNNVNVTGDVRQYAVETAKSSVVQDPRFEPIKSNSRGEMQGNYHTELRKDGNPLEGADLFQPESDTNKNVYRGGFSSFCSACHGDFHGGNQESGRSDGRNRAGGSWVKHPTNLRLGESSKYGVDAYTASITNTQGTNPNPVGYDWKYPVVKGDYDFSVKSSIASAAQRSISSEDRIMCLTCHKAHATQFKNMTRWDTEAHAFIAAGQKDFAGEISIGDNPAYGCGKCHQMGGTAAYVKAF